tara:strand:+ start:148 stop:258 length:111 start_codon:yes stop_codon:yes gene_type:complete
MNITNNLKEPLFEKNDEKEDIEKNDEKEDIEERVYH